jgi:hypothetical protein
VPEAGEVGVVGDDALPDEVLEMDRKSHISRDARDSFECWLGLVGLGCPFDDSLLGPTAALLD